MPGAISPATGLVKNANSVFLIGKPFDRDLEAALGREVRLANDADCFALSEATDGAGAGAPTVFGVILGTGVGAGIVVNGHLLSGPNAIAGEWGHNQLPWMLPDELPGPDCYCGKKGCIESWNSGPAFELEYALAEKTKLTTHEIVATAEAGARPARSALRYAGPARPRPFPCHQPHRSACDRAGWRHVECRGALRRSAVALGRLCLLRSRRYEARAQPAWRLERRARRGLALARDGWTGGWGGMTEAAPRPGFCRDCFTPVAEGKTRCPACNRPRLVFHAELHDLGIAHLDCDAFYAAVEKRDNPDLLDKPLIIGGGKRGVVSTCCYIARIRGVRSAMPMFKALQACPEAVVIRPDMQKYARVGREVRQMMRDLTPLVEPLSIDEAFLDLNGTERLHHASPAITMAKLQSRIEKDIGITVSVGMSYCKFLAKIASDMDKPRGFSVIGKEEAPGFLATKPVSLIWGVGKAFEAKLARDGISRIAQLQKMEENDLMARYGTMGRRLWRLSRGLDVRSVSSANIAKSISAETTFFDDIHDAAELDRRLWPLCEKVAQRAKAAGASGQTVVLKLKNRRVQDTNAERHAPRSDAACRSHLQDRRTAACERSRRHGLSPARHRPFAAWRRRSRRPARHARSGGHAARGGRTRDGQGAREVRRRRDHKRARDQEVRLRSPSTRFTQSRTCGKVARSKPASCAKRV